MRGIIVTAILGSAALFAQPTEQPPVLSRNIQLQLNTLNEEFQMLNKDFAAVNEQVKKENPGWHLGGNLQLEKDAPAKVEPKK